MLSYQPPPVTPAGLMQHQCSAHPAPGRHSSPGNSCVGWGASQYLASIMLDSEAAVRQGRVIEEAGTLAHPALKVLVGGTDLVQLFQEGLVGDSAGAQAFFIQHGQDSIRVLREKKRRSFLPSLLLCSDN